MAIENSITFGEVNSADFGIYISGEGVFNAPQRDVEMIEIPGRNGEFALDNGRFKNIEVSYPAFNFEPDDYDSFVQNLSDFRNAICSQRGYQRLTDTFHPDEYREAVYIGGLEIKPVKYNTASEFTIVFDCKPQRFLLDGENPVSLSDGDTLLNPTLFESSPLLKFKGYGAIEFNGYEIGIGNVPLGEIQLWGTKYPSFYPPTFEKVYTFDTTHLVSGDSIYFQDDSTQIVDIIKLDKPQAGILEAGQVTSQINVVKTAETADAFDVTCRLWPDLSSGFIYGTPSTISASATFNYLYKGVARSSLLSVSVVYDGNDTITITPSRTATYPSGLTPRNSMSGGVGVLLAYSSEPAITDYVYCDTDIGEFYRIEGGEYISMNHVGDLGSDLPTLAPGTNTVTYDNTITELNIAPRWWKI